MERTHGSGVPSEGVTKKNVEPLILLVEIALREVSADSAANGIPKTKSEEYIDPVRLSSILQLSLWSTSADRDS
jgi:hypothetical protein